MKSCADVKNHMKKDRTILHIDTIAFFALDNPTDRLRKKCGRTVVKSAAIIKNDLWIGEKVLPLTIYRGIVFINVKGW